MTGSRYAQSLEEIKEMLVLNVEDVARHYAPEASGCHVTNGEYWTLNPGRADTRVGSFKVSLTGPHAGKWHDFTTDQGGSLLDLIMLAMDCDIVEAIREAKRYLGLANESPADRRRREQQLERQRARRAQQSRENRAKQQRQRDQAQAIWLSGAEDLAGTPVEAYLRDTRGIDLGALPRPVGALRYHPELFYKHVDNETGEIIETKLPAMVALAHDGQSKPACIHRTYLGQSSTTGRWGKADVPQAKKIFGTGGGAAIHLWRGIGPRQGKPASLFRAHTLDGPVTITEGIEDGLSAIVLQPRRRVLCAMSLGNMGRIELPDLVKEVLLIADQDENEDARAMLQRVIGAHGAAGRLVRVWKPQGAGKDLNDALRAAQAAENEQRAG